MELTKHLSGLLAVKKVSIKAKEGEIMGLIGPKGAGKKNLKDAATALLEKRLAEYIQPGIDSNIQKKLSEYEKNRKAE